MRLSNFIQENVEEIAVEWEKFAATLMPDKELSSSLLRNTIKELLHEIAIDMDEPQDSAQQQLKSEGHKRLDPLSFAETHAMARAKKD